MIISPAFNCILNPRDIWYLTCILDFRNNSWWVDGCKILSILSSAVFSLFCTLHTTKCTCSVVSIIQSITESATFTWGRFGSCYSFSSPLPLHHHYHRYHFHLNGHPGKCWQPHSLRRRRKRRRSPSPGLGWRCTCIGRSSEPDTRSDRIGK